MTGKYSELVFKKEPYITKSYKGTEFDEKKYNNDLANTIKMLGEQGFICVVRNEVDNIIIEYNYADRSFGCAYPFWLLPKEEESVTYEDESEG